MRTDTAPEPLRRALNEIDKLRRRSLWMTRFLLAFMIPFWVASALILLFSENKWLGVAIGLNAVMTGISAVGINLGGLAYRLAGRILTELEGLSRDRAEPRPAS